MRFLYLARTVSNASQINLFERDGGLIMEKQIKRKSDIWRNHSVHFSEYELVMKTR